MPLIIDIGSKEIVSLDKIVKLAQEKQLYEINKEFLLNNNCIKKTTQKVKILLGTKDIIVSSSLFITVDACSQSVNDKINAAGGKVTLITKNN